MSKAVGNTARGRHKRSGNGRWKTLRKHLYQRFWGGRSAGETPVVVFLVGDTDAADGQVVTLLERSYETEVYRSDHPRAFEQGELRPDETLRGLIGRSRAPVMVFALAETPSASELGALVERFQPARALWLYEDHERCAGVPLGDAARRQLHGRLRHIGRPDARAGEQSLLPADLAPLARDPDIDDASARALAWYHRHERYRSGRFDSHRQMRLFGGNQLRLTPKESYTALLEAAGIGTDILDENAFASVPRRTNSREVALDEPLASACENLQVWLDRHASA